MRLFVRFRAGKLVAGIGVILAGTLSGCWDAQKRPAGPTNFPKGTLNPNTAGGQPNGTPAGWPGNPNLNNNGAPVNRTSGIPPFVEQSGRAGVGSPLSGNVGGSANTGLLNPPGANGGPIATNGSNTKSGIQPVGANLGPAPGGAGSPGGLMPGPEDLPLREAKADSIPSVPPISLQSQDPRTRYRRPSPPPIPEDSLSPAVSLPSKNSPLPPPTP